MIVEAARKFTSLAIPSQDQLVFGTSLHPLACGLGLTIGAGLAAEKLHLSRKEQQWLTRIESGLDELPAEEAAFIAALEQQYGSSYDKASYGL
jgi:hypothetical protein